jgi:hypothetical protein
MHNCEQNARLTSRRYRTSTLIVISFVVLVACSVPVFETRFLNDMEFYTLVADKLLLGRVLYRDALDTKPPLVFLIIDEPPGRSVWSLDRYPQMASLLANYHPCRPIDDLCVYLRKE